MKRTVEIERPRIVCLCGSTRFKSAFDDANYKETMAGNIVLSVGFFMHATGNEHGGKIGCTDEEKIKLDVLHFRKIDLCDEILVLNVGGYVGESTAREIRYAQSIGKHVRWLERHDHNFSRFRFGIESYAAEVPYHSKVETNQA